MPVGAPVLLGAIALVSLLSNAGKKNPYIAPIEPVKKVTSSSRKLTTSSSGNKWLTTVTFKKGQTVHVLVTAPKGQAMKFSARSSKRNKGDVPVLEYSQILTQEKKSGAQNLTNRILFKRYPEAGQSLFDLAVRDFGVQVLDFESENTSAPADHGAHRSAEATGEMPMKFKQLMGKALRALTVNDNGVVTGPVTTMALQVATSAASQLDKAGWHSAAKTIRDFAKIAAKMAPKAKPSENVPLPKGVPADLQNKVNTAIRMERDPEKLKVLITELSKLPNAADPQVVLARQMLEAILGDVEAKIATAAALSKVDDTLKNAPEADDEPVPTTRPLAKPVARHQAKPVARRAPGELEAEAMIANLLSNEDNLGLKAAKKKYSTALVSAFQSAVGTTADGYAGPSTLIRASGLIKSGRLPHVFQWPKGSTAAKVLEYRKALNTLADRADELGQTARASALRLSAEREHGEGGIVGQMPGTSNSSPARVKALPVASRAPVQSTPEAPYNDFPNLPVSTARSPKELAAENMINDLSANEKTYGVEVAKNKFDRGLVAAFQNAAGLTADGKPGPGTMLAAAALTKSGVLPHVMQWPNGSTSSKVLDYRSKLNALGDLAENQGQVPRATQLRASALREHGEGGIVGALLV
jgi:peptidoglycan hydrolase-like protein with peptidoglycan-binding domain